eukprot:724809_1
MSSDCLYRIDKWERKNLRKKIQKKRDIGTHFRIKRNTTRKWKLSKRRRSQRQYLIKTTKQDTDNYVTDDRITVHHIETAGRRICMICFQYRDGEQMTTVDCSVCRDFLFRKMDDSWEHRFELRYTICIECSYAADICTSHSRHPISKKSFFCKEYQTCHGDLCSHNLHQGLPRIFQRTNELFEPLQMELVPGVYRYQVDKNIFVKKYQQRCLMMRIEHHEYRSYDRIFCETCAGSLQTCEYGNCTNKETVRDEYSLCLCFNHYCVTCGTHHNTMPNINCHGGCYAKKCNSCSKTYCVQTYRDEHEVETWSDCGSVEYHLCNTCFIQKERNPIKHAVFNLLPFCSDISQILYEYSIGYVARCGNYKSCQNTVCFDSTLCFESSAQDIDGNVFYFYNVCNPNSQQRNREYLIKIGDQYLRMFCGECIVLMWACTYKLCKNLDIMIGSTDRKQGIRYDGLKQWFSAKYVVKMYARNVSGMNMWSAATERSQRIYRLHLMDSIHV